MSVRGLLENLAASLRSARNSKAKGVRALLGEVFSRIDRLRKADDQAPDFRIFDYLRTDEYSLSRCFRDLLDPKGKHAQGRLFLDLFLKKAGADDWAVADQCLEVVQEKPTDQQRRIDIYLRFPNGVIGIENKPWAGEEDQQLSHYADWLERTAARGGGDWLLVYLSDRDPHSICENEREQLECNGHFVKMSYREEVVDWLEGAAGKTKAKTVRVFVSELVKFIRTHINRELNMCEEETIREAVLQSAESLEAAYLVNHALSSGSIQRYLFQELAHKVSERLNEYGFIVHVAPGFFSGDAHRNCDVFFDEAQDANLFFAFDTSSYQKFFWGIAKKSPDVQKNEQERAAIDNTMQLLFGGSNPNRPEKWGLYWWNYANTFGFDGDYRNWWTPNSLEAMRNGSLVEAIVQIAIRTRQGFAKCPHLLLPAAPH